MRQFFQRSIVRGVMSLLVLTAAGSAVAQRDLRDIPAPDPELERSTFRLPEGFEVNLFAADPKIAKPIQMNFDEAGRLWIVSSEVYPHIEPGAPASDRVIVLEDFDHDGVSDATHEFAEGLLIPTGIVPGDGGAYVANSTELLHFSDSDGDLKADAKRIVLSGFGTEDTHHILHTLRWGPDGYLYFNQSIYIHSHIETPWGVRRLNAGGIWQFRPETLELGVFLRGLVNPWGHHFDRFGQSFATDGAGGEGINYVIPGAYYFTAADAPEILSGLNPGSPKHCGLEIVETPMLPPDWQGSAITNDFRGHRVCRFVLTEDRSGFVSREQQEVIWSDHVAFRPIDVKLGPDGAIYIADWYNPIIQHGEVDFRDPRRDHTHGRIWRVSWTGASDRGHVDLPSLSNEELFEQLRSPDNFRRQAAKQLLRQRDGDVAAELRTWLAKANPNAEHLKLEALWVFQAARQIEPELLSELLQAQSPEVRAAAVRVLSHWKYQIANSRELLDQRVLDAHPRVRLEAVRALSFSPNEASELARAAAENNSRRPNVAPAHDATRISSIMKAADLPTDRFLDYGIRLSAREQFEHWEPAYREGRLNFDSVDHVLAAFAAVGRGAPLDLLLEKVNVASVTKQQRQQLTSLVLDQGTAEQIARFLETAPLESDPDILRQALDHTGREKKRLALSEPLRSRILARDNAELRRLGLRATGQWQLPDFASTLKQISDTEDAPLEDRIAALTGMALTEDAATVNELRQFAGNQKHPVPLRKHAVVALAGVRPEQAAAIAADMLTVIDAGQRPGDIAAAFLSMKGGEQLLARSLAGASFSSDVARDMLRAVRESGLAAAELEAAVRSAGSVTSRKELSSEERSRLLKMATESAHAADGEAVYRNPQLGCLKCHAIGGAGGKVGPDMISLGGSAQPDYLLESLLNPNAKVKENYNTVVVVTTDGKLQSGIQVQQSDETVTLRNADDELVQISRADIEEITPGLSLMPEGQVDSLTDQELAALVRFLSELGRTPEYTLSRREFARTWDVMSATREAVFRLRRTSYGQAATDDPAFQWNRRYSTVAGVLPLNDIPVVDVRIGATETSRGFGFVRCHLNVETAGTVALRFNDVSGLELRVNEKPVILTNDLLLDVTPGRLRLTLTVDGTARNQPLQLEIIRDKTTAVATMEQ
ncbi:MAG: HEAT repeat domain-containing protein [Planctomycetaceae bacterium]